MSRIEQAGELYIRKLTYSNKQIRLPVCNLFRGRLDDVVYIVISDPSLRMDSTGKENVAEEKDEKR